MEQPCLLVDILLVIEPLLVQESLRYLLDSPEGGVLDDRPLLLIEDLAGQEPPEDLQDQLDMVRLLCDQDLLQVEQILLCLLILARLKLDLSMSEEVLAVLEGDALLLAKLL